MNLEKKNKTLNSLRKMKKKTTFKSVKQTMSESLLTTDIKVWTLLYLLYKWREVIQYLVILLCEFNKCEFSPTPSRSAHKLYVIYVKCISPSCFTWYYFNHLDSGYNFGFRKPSSQRTEMEASFDVLYPWNLWPWGKAWNGWHPICSWQ